MSTLEILREARRRGDFRALAAAVPYARFLGIDLEMREGQLLGLLRYDDALIGNPMIPALHGGTLGALLESTAIFQIGWEVELTALPRTITLTVNYLRSGRPRDVLARATIARQGRRVASVSVEAWQDDPERPIATATGHFLIQGEAPAGG
ncbi:MAG: PaaI family thioesterase [Myxococcales bacterium]|nr:PaaI family thioesterase [Myxococcales bacterium]